MEPLLGAPDPTLAMGRSPTLASICDLMQDRDRVAPINHLDDLRGGQTQCAHQVLASLPDPLGTVAHKDELARLVGPQRLQVSQHHLEYDLAVLQCSVVDGMVLLLYLPV